MVNEVQVNGNQGLPSGLQTNPWALEEEAVHENYHQNSIEGRRHFLSKGANVDTLWYSVFSQVRGGSSFGSFPYQAPVLETRGSTLLLGEYTHAPTSLPVILFY